MSGSGVDVFGHERVCVLLILLEFLSNSSQLSFLLHVLELRLLHVLLQTQLLDCLCFEVLTNLIEFGV